MKVKSVYLRTILFVALLLATNSPGYAADKSGSGNKNAAAAIFKWNFDREPVGTIPAGAKVFAGEWAVRKESDAPSLPHALCQGGSAEYPALSLSDKVYADVTVSTRFKPVSGNSDRAAGIIFRIQNKDNYYILRANALEDNVNIYKYAGGQRSVLNEGSAKVPSGRWQELRVEVKGNRIRGFLNGKLVVEATDDTYKSGKVGLWTKADSVTCFDDVLIGISR